jgi:hypothetical protein
MGFIVFSPLCGSAAVSGEGIAVISGTPVPRWVRPSDASPIATGAIEHQSVLKLRQMPRGAPSLLGSPELGPAADGL